MVGDCILVFLTALSPVGEELIAIPLGVALGLPPIIAALVAVSSNYLPVAVICAVFSQADRFPRFARVLVRLQSKRGAMVAQRGAGLVVVLATPWIGVYATTVGLELVGVSRSRILVLTAVSLVGYAVISTTLSVLVF